MIALKVLTLGFLLFFLRHTQRESQHYDPGLSGWPLGFMHVINPMLLTHAFIKSRVWKPLHLCCVCTVIVMRYENLDKGSHELNSPYASSARHFYPPCAGIVTRYIWYIDNRNWGKRYSSIPKRERQPLLSWHLLRRRSQVMQSFSVRLHDNKCLISVTWTQRARDHVIRDFAFASSLTCHPIWTDWFTRENPGCWLSSRRRVSIVSWQNHDRWLRQNLGEMQPSKVLQNTTTLCEQLTKN